MLVDSHCHLDLMTGTQPDTVIAAACQQGVTHCLSVAVDLTSFATLVEIAQRFTNVFISVGIHPNSAHDQETDVQTLCQLAANSAVVAVGETGLDYFRSHGDLTWQHERFRTHIRAAKQVGKPLIIHNREAKADTLRVLREENAATVGGVMHCFSEDWDTAQEALDLGFYISFSGIVTFKSAKTLQAVAKRVPAERLLVETDSPYLTPVPHRGKANQPAYVRHVAEFVANLRDESLEKLAKTTTENFFRLFNTATEN